MAGRKPEPGISYYRMNCGHTINKKVRLLFNEFDSNGYWIWQCIIDYAYSHKGYFFDCSDHDALELFATDVCKKQVSLVNEVIRGCIRRGLFDKSVFDMFGILTSIMMQEIYLDATYERRRKGTEIELCKELILITLPTDSVNISIVPWKKSILPRNNDNVPGSNATEKSRVEEMKEEKSRVEPNGVAPQKPAPPKKISKKGEQPEPHWEQLVKVWFDFNKEKFKREPSFKDRDPVFFKKIVQQLKKRAEKKNVEWSETIAIERMRKFLDYALKDGWLKEHFLLENLLKQFDIIIQPKKKAIATQGAARSPVMQSLMKIQKDINYCYERFLEGASILDIMYTQDFDFLTKNGMKLNDQQVSSMQLALNKHIVDNQIENKSETIDKLQKQFSIIEHFKFLKSQGHVTVFRME